jgi:hypothetical protein
MRRKLTAIVLAALVFSLIAASAASLGGIATAELGADATVVASCDTDGVTVAYNTSYTPGGPGKYEVTSVDVTDINGNCNGYSISVTLGDGTNALGSGSASVSGTAATVSISGNVDAEAVTEIGIVISN